MAGPRRHRVRTAIAWTGGLVVATAFIGAAVVAQGYDTERLPTLETNVWIARDASGGQYARFNTDVGEIQTVNDAKGVGGILQSGSAAVVLGTDNAKYWSIDSASPVDIGVDASTTGTSTTGASAAPGTSAADGVANPNGSGDVVVAGDYVLFEGSTPSWTRAADLGDASAAARLDPYSAMSRPDGARNYAAAASTISRSGVVAMYSAQDAEQRITTVDLVRGTWSTASIADPPDATTPVQMTMVGDRWVLLALGSSPRLWVSGRSEPIDLNGVLAPSTSPLLQGPGAAAAEVVIASSVGADLIGLDDGADRRIAAAGTPARPESVGDEIAAGWITPAGAAIWTSGMPAAKTGLDIDSSQFNDNIAPAPVIATNGDRAVLVEQMTGMLWTVPDGQYIPVTAWTAGEPPPQAGDVVVDDAKQQEPPVAEPDVFGVRSGAIATLPVLDNDHDVNAADVLSIDPGSVQGLDPAFGTLRLTSDDQQLVVDVTGAVPTGTFTYRVTDGLAASEPTTVTLSLKDGNSAPQWCDEVVQPACLIDWPAPQIAPGGTTTIDVLRGWIDPEGDAVAIASAVPAAGTPIVAMPTSDGRLAIADTDAAGTGGVYRVMVSVMDSRGAISAAKELDVTVTGDPGFALRGGVVVGTAGTASVAAIGDYASGGSGSFQITDAVDTSAAPGRLQLERNAAKGTVTLEADQAGEYATTITVQDTVTQRQLTATLRFSVSDPGAISIPPLTAYVRSGQDTLIDVLGAVQNTTSKTLLVTAATPDSTAIAAAVSDAAAVQIRTTDPTLTAGALGDVRVDLADAAGDAYTAQIAVFLIAPSSDDQPIAMPDTATVRAGQVVDIPVLANDVAPYGERLALSPELDAPNAPVDALAFTTGTELRYRAPEAAGSYVVYYEAYAPSNPTARSRAQVTIQVLPAGSNRAPQAVDVTARGAAGQTITIPIDTGGMDPDGDPVVVASVTQPGDPALGAVQVGADGASLVYYAPEADSQQPVAGWQAAFTYTVRDPAGLTSTANVAVAVTTRDLSDDAPLVFADQVRVQQVAAGGDPRDVTVSPLANDCDPAGGCGADALRILYAVAPDASGAVDDPSSPAGLAAQLLVPSTAEPGAAEDELYPDGEVHFRITEATAPGTYRFLYTVESRRSLSTAQGLIVITVSAGSVSDLPIIQDTVVTAADRSQLASGGIDVLSGKVTWPTGDTAALAATLELAPGAPAGFSVRGTTGRITGPLPEDGAIVPFQVHGVDASGTEFTTYGLLRIPGADDFRLSVVIAPDPIRETETGDIRLEDILDLGAGDQVEVSPASAFATHRPTSDAADPTRCELKPGTASTIEYHASYFPGNASDTCTITVRIAGQSDAAWATLVIPISITPIDPLAVLTPTTRTISIVTGPESLNLYQLLVSWTGGTRISDLTKLSFSWTYGGSAFTVSPPSATASPDGTASNDELTVTAKADAQPGTREMLRVTVRYPYEPRTGRPTPPDYEETVTLVLVVGMTPSQGPAGATIPLSCSARDQPTGCDVLAVLPTDVQGQFNPISSANASGDTTLRLAGLGGTAQTFECTGLATATIDGTRVRFSWLPAEGDRYPGGTCTVPFTVVDRQGRTGTGQILLDAAGYPAKPGAPVTSGYTGDSVTLDIPLGDAANARPAVTGIKLYDADTGQPMPSTSCTLKGAGAYRCVVSGLTNGQIRHIAATAVNAVGESVMTSAVTTNAYLAPAFDPGKPSYDDQVYVAGTTTASQGVVAVSACAQNGVQRIRFTVGSFTQEISTGGGNCIPSGTRLTLPVGAQTIVATPISAFAPPDGSGGAAVPGGGVTTTVNVRGAAAFTSGPVLSVDAGATQLTVQFQVDPGNATAAGAGGDGTRGGIAIHVLAWLSSDTAPSCVAADSPTGTGGGLAITGGGASLVDHVLTSTVTSDVLPIGAGGLTPNSTYRVKVCASFGYGRVQSSTATAMLFRAPAAPTASDLTYTSAATPTDMGDYLTVSGTTYTWTVPNTAPTNNAAADFASQLAALDPAPAGSSWQVRYATSPGGPYTATSIADNTSTWYAEFCFTDGSGAHCGAHSAAITSKYGSVGIPFGSSGTVTLPSATQCLAAVTAVNDAIAQAGAQAVEQDRVQTANDARSTAQQAEYAGLITAAFTSWAASYVYDPAPTNPGIDPGIFDAYLNGYGAYPGFDDVYPGASDPSYDPSTDPNAAQTLQNARTAGQAAATAEANDRAATAGQAAYDSAYAGYDPNSAAAQTIRANAEQAVYANPSFAYPSVQVTGITPNPPFGTPSRSAIGDDASRRYSQLRYVFDGSAANQNVAYVLQAIVAQLGGTTYTCG